MIGFIVFVVSGLASAYLFGLIPGPSIPLNPGAGFALAIVTALISIAGAVGAVLSLT